MLVIKRPNKRNNMVEIRGEIPLATQEKQVCFKALTRAVLSSNSQALRKVGVLKCKLWAQWIR